jgi:hypothetical protein
MYLILLGAGASYGSSAHLVPPMGSGLFKELQRFNPPKTHSHDLRSFFPNIRIKMTMNYLFLPKIYGHLTNAGNGTTAGV